MPDYVRDMLIARRSIGNAGFVFPGRFANSHIADVEKSFKAIAAATGIVVSPHDMRRTFASVAGSTAIPPYTLSALLNHSAGTGVTAGYVIMGASVLRESAEIVAKRIESLCGTLKPDAQNVVRLSREPSKK